MSPMCRTHDTAAAVGYKQKRNALGYLLGRETAGSRSERQSRALPRRRYLAQLGD